MKKRGSNRWSAFPKGKKAFIFSLFVLTAISLVMFNFKMRGEFKEDNRAEMFKVQARQMNRFVNDVEKDMERALQVSGYSALVGLGEWIGRNMSYLDNASNRIQELMLNGSINTTIIEAMDESTLINWTERIQNLSLKYRLNFTYDNLSVEAKQAAPFYVNITGHMHVFMIDFTKTISWDFNITKTVEVYIGKGDIFDPMYFLESMDNYDDNNAPPDSGWDAGTAINNTIRESPYTLFAVNNSIMGGSLEYDFTNLSLHTYGQMYKEWDEGPSFFMRMEGRLDCASYVQECINYGIESFVNVTSNSMWDRSSVDIDTCAADYQFFLGSGCSEIHKFESPSSSIMDPKFYLDESHKDSTTYGLENFNSS